MATPKPSKQKELPIGSIIQQNPLSEIELNKNIPSNISLDKEQPVEIPQLTIVPDESKPVETIPEASPEKSDMPSDFIEENCVVVGEKKIEIKPTKLKYFRNKAASAYGIIKAVPLHELLTYGKGIIDESRDADQLLYDFLVAAFDDPVFVRDNYDEMDADVIEKIIKIFGRLNHIDEKEEQARKNKEAQAEKR